MVRSGDEVAGILDRLEVNHESYAGTVSTYEGHWAAWGLSVSGDIRAALWR